LLVEHGVVQIAAPGAVAGSRGKHRICPRRKG
jgi:hypothetical protein